MKKRTKLAAGAGRPWPSSAPAGCGDEAVPGRREQGRRRGRRQAAQRRPAKLNDALKQALKNRIDEAVKAGR